MAGPLVVTGATGFVGRALLAAHPGLPTLSMRGEDWAREAEAAPFAGATVLHLAGRVHEPRGDAAAFMRDNADKTRRLAEIARRGGARRIVYLSSVKVNGDESARPFTRADRPAPADAYARSKLAAEEALLAVAGADLDVCIVRAPLVYGHGARANLAALLRLADSPWPLPFAALDNRRSFVHVDDLVALLLACAAHAAAGGMTYFAAHEQPASTRELVTELRRALRRPPRLFAVAAATLEMAAAVTGLSAKVRRLTRSLEADPGDARAELGWRAGRGLEACVRDLAGVAPERAA